MNIEFIIRMSIIIIGTIGMLLMATKSLTKKPKIDFLFYFTNLSNIFVILYFIFKPDNNLFLFLVTLNITYTMVVFNCILYPYLIKHNMKFKDVGTDPVSSNIAHIIIPILVLVYWFKYSQDVSYLDIIYGSIFPIIYLVFALFLGGSKYKIEDGFTNYIYPFLDVEKYGFKKVLLNNFLLSSLFIGIGFLLIFLK